MTEKIIEEKRDAEQFIRLIAPEYMGVYIVDRETDYFRDIIGPNYFREIVQEKEGRYSKALKIYTDRYVLEEDQGIIQNLLDYDSLYKKLLSGEEINVSYRRKSNIRVSLRIRRYSQLQEEKNLSIWIYTNEETKDKLRRVQEEAKRKNEIISAIGKSYYYISRIDLEMDRYEVVSGLENFHDNIKREDCLSKSLQANCRKIIDGAYLENFLEFIDVTTLADRLQDEESIVMEYRLLNGSWHKARLIVKKRNEKGRVIHVLCAVRNISDEKRKERLLAAKAAESRREAMEKTRFLSNMSHDIRTPMNGIVGLIDIADQHPDNPEIQEQCKKKIKELSGYLVSIVNDILDINKLQTDDFVMQDVAFDLTDMLRSSNEAAQIKATEKNIEYVVDWEKSIISHRCLVGNPIYVARILSIIADNAIKFSDSGSTISVWCIEKQVDEKNLIYEFCCQDHGVGMSEEFAEHAFDMFSQEDAGSRTRYEGTGLGLAIAKKLADRLNGTIHIESEKGVGTKVSVTMPFKMSSPDDIQPVPDDYENISLQGLRALIVEDNELNMEIAKFIIEAQGMCVECATDGMQALEMFEQSKTGYYDVILMDIMMPRLNGLDATRRIRTLQQDDAEAVPIIAMSANVFAEDIIKSRLAGMNAHLSKPLDANKITEAIRKSLFKNVDRKHLT